MREQENKRKQKSSKSSKESISNDKLNSKESYRDNKLNSKESYISASKLKGIRVLVGLLLLYQISLFVYNKWFVELPAEDTQLFNSDFSFNPNTISLDSLVLLGLSPKQAQTILNYRAKGGKFRKREDFAKMYVVTPEFYSRVEGRIVIEEEQKMHGAIMQGHEQGAETEPQSGKQQYAQKQYIQREGQVATGGMSSTSTSASISTSTSASASISTSSSAFSATSSSAVSSTSSTSSTSSAASAAASAASAASKSGLFGKQAPSKKPYICNLNSADSAALVRLYGIGPYYAKKILEYRERLGGSFVAAEQLMEVYGVDSVKFEGIKNNIVVKSNSIKKFNLEDVSEEFLERHPYIGAYAARGIKLLIKLNRERDSTYHITAQELIDNNILQEESGRKLEFYLHL